MIRILPPFSFWKKLSTSQLYIRVAVGMMLLFSAVTPVAAQNISGQWIGRFTSEEDPGGGGTDYVLEIESNGGQLSGYSYTYFSIAGKRYFVICRLKGNYDKGSKSLVISEVETVKTNTPPDFENCHQSHQLTYLKQKDKETLVGKWKPTEKGSTCGKGFTELERKALVKENASKNIEETKKTPVQQSTLAKKDVAQTKPKTPATSPIKKTTPNDTKVASKPSVPAQKAIVKNTVPKSAPTNPSTEPKTIITEEPPVAIPPKVAQQSVKDNYNEKKNIDKSALPAESGKAKNMSDNTKEKLAKRTYQVIKVIEVSQPNIKVDIYDNGQVDGDVVSIYLNDKQLVSSKMLTAQPITLQIKIDDQEEIYDLIMYAESLGSIPPNTALMIVTTPTQRYEINISSNEQTSGAIRFKFKK
ncbi:MAG: hypothetical protein RLZZ204_1377 [Bacteroidota bacterium]